MSALKYIARTLAFAVLIFGYGAARADYIVYHAILHCSGSEAIIRFGESYSNDEPIILYDLPSQLSAKWSNTNRADANHCLLPNGDELTVRYGRKQPSATGMGGGDPPWFFSFWINGTKVISREDFYPGFNGSARLNNISYRPGQLGRCSFGGTWPAYMRPVGISIDCTEQVLDLDRIPPDPLEQPGQQRAVGTISVTSSYDLSFCRSFIQRGNRGVRIGSVATKETEVLNFPNAEMPFWAVSAWHIARFDFNNDGVADTVVNVWDYRGSNRLLVKLGGASDEETDEIVAIPKYELIRIERTLLAKGWEEVEGYSTDYGSNWVWLNPVLMDGMTYILATPVNGEEMPSALLLRTSRKDGVPTRNGGWDTLCTFQLIEEISEVRHVCLSASPTSGHGDEQPDFLLATNVCFDSKQTLPAGR